MILAIDPGTMKSGIAIVEEDGSLLYKTIISTGDLEKEITSLLQHYDLRAIVTGDGTNHASIKMRVKKILVGMDKKIPIKLVNEKYTTEMGKARYWVDHKPTGWKRMIPQGMLTIPVPIDDYVAWIIGSIYLGHIKAENVGHKKV